MDRNMDKTGLSAIRKEIDALDAQMRALLLARARLVEEVQKTQEQKALWVDLNMKTPKLEQQQVLILI
ncbi:MAG: hypothetical protein VXW20_07755 [Pseudomonadota bacterium]|nr:hypothetical protein [Pseudomonadota bacterium]